MACSRNGSRYTMRPLTNQKQNCSSLLQISIQDNVSHFVDKIQSTEGKKKHLVPSNYSNLTPPICSEIHPAVFNFASILAAAIPCPLPLNRFWKQTWTLRFNKDGFPILHTSKCNYYKTYLHSCFALGNKLLESLLVR